MNAPSARRRPRSTPLPITHAEFACGSHARVAAVAPITVALLQCGQLGPPKNIPVCTYKNVCGMGRCGIKAYGKPLRGENMKKIFRFLFGGDCAACRSRRSHSKRGDMSGERKFNKSNGVDDLVLLEDVTQDSIVANLETRFKKDLIYSYIGRASFSQPVPQDRIFVRRVQIRKYRPAQVRAQSARVRSRRGNVPQHAVHASGTVRARLWRVWRRKDRERQEVLPYISAVSTSANDGDRLKEQLLKSNRCLRRLATPRPCATTTRRASESTWRPFSLGGRRSAGALRIIFWKSPRCFAWGGERNFHIFYQLCAGAEHPDAGEDGKLVSKLGLEGGTGDFHYLGRSTDTKVKGMSDSDDFIEMKDAMADVGLVREDEAMFSPQQLCCIWQRHAPQAQRWG